MNRRPSRSRTDYDSFSPHHTANFKAAKPDTHFFDTRKKRSFGLKLAQFFLFFILLVFAGNFIANQFVFVKSIQVPVRSLSEEHEGYTLLHISDLKGASFGSKQGLLTFALGKAEYDAVVLTGDMISSRGNAQPFYALIEALRSRNPDAPIYFIPGDSDPPAASERNFAGGSPFAPWVLGAQQRGATLLHAPLPLTSQEQTIWLMPSTSLNLDVNTMQGQYEQQYLHALSSGDKNAEELAAFNLKGLEDTRSARSAMKENDPIITLTHVPPQPHETWPSDANLTLCGHYLGGMICLPFVGPLFVPAQHLPRYGLFPGTGRFNGLQRSGRSLIYTNPGLGSSTGEYPSFFFRLFNPPSVTLLTLTPSSL